MKKFLLSLATVALATTAVSATTVTYDFATSDYGLTRTNDNNAPYVKEADLVNGNVKLTLGLNENSGNGFRLWTDALRIMKTNDGSATISVNVPDATVTALDVKVNAAFTSFKVDGTSVSYTSDGKHYSWTGDATNPVIEVSCTATNRFYSIEVTYESTLSGDQKPAGLSFSESVTYGAAGETFLPSLPVLNNPNNLPVTWSSSDTEIATVTDWGDGFVMVQTTGKVGTAVISVHSDATEEFGEGSASYTIHVMEAADTVAELLEKAPNKGDKILVNRAFTVLYANGNYVYVTDDMGGYTLLWQPQYKYQAGDIIRGGWEATNATYNQLVEFTGNFPESTSNFAPEYATAETVTLDNVNQVLYLNNITFAEATPVLDADNTAKTNFTGTTADGTELTFRTNWDIESVPAGTYKVFCAVSRFNETLQIFPISYEEPTTPVVFPDVPEYLEATCDGNEADVKYGVYDDIPMTTITATTDKDAVNVTVVVPEGWDAIMHSPIDSGDGGDVNPLFVVRRANESDWMPVSNFANWGMQSGNEFAIPADGEEYEIQCYLVFGENVDTANMFLVNVTATKAGASEPVYPEHLEATSNAVECHVTYGSYDGYPETTVEAKTNEHNPVMVTVTVPEGWDGILHYPLQSDDEGIEPLVMRRVEAAEWVPVTTLVSNGLVLGNEIEVPANGQTFDINCYLVKDGQADMANVYFVSVTAVFDTNAAVEEIEAADANAVYFNLQGVQVENPANGVYVKVVNGKATKVVLK